MLCFVPNLYSDLPSFEGDNSFVRSSKAAAPPTAPFEMLFLCDCKNLVLKESTKYWNEHLSSNINLLLLFQ